MTSPRLTLPPGPRSPAAVQLSHWLRRPFAFMDACAARFGDTFTVRFAGFGTLVFFSNPEDLRAIFTGDPDLLHSGEANSALSDILGRHSVLTLDGAEHLRQRKLLLPPFQGERMQAYAAVMRDATLRAIDAWPVGEPFALHPFMQSITLEVILKAVFGVDEGAGKSRLTAALARLLATIGSPYSLLIPAVLSAFGRTARDWATRKLTRETDEALYAEIAARRAASGGPERHDILSMLLRARHEDGQPMSDHELRDELMTLLVAGHETTATALAWTFQLVLAHPEVRAKIEAELEAAGVAPPIDAARLAHLDGLDAAVKESLRLRPILPIVVRLTKGPVTINGRTFPAGVRLAPCIYLTQRRPELYPDPEVFRPERFAGKKPDPYGWIPFGGGIRRCIGISFALLEMRVVVASVLASVRLRLAPGPGPVVRRRGITLAPSTGTLVVNEGRRATQAPSPTPGSRSSSAARTSP